MIAYPNVKVNLGLSVLHKRPDGYHDLETLFLPYPDIHDTLKSLPATISAVLPPRFLNGIISAVPKLRRCPPLKIVPPSA